MLLAVTAVLAVVIGFWASNVGGAALGAATGAIRGDAKRGAAIIEDATFLYAEDAPLAYAIAEAEFLADEADKQAADAPRGLSADLLISEAAAQHGLARLLAPGARLVEGEPSDATGLDGEALMRRLAILRGGRPELTEIDVEAIQAEAANDRRRSTLLVAALIPLAFAVFFGSLGQAFEHRRSLLVGAGWACTAGGVLFALVAGVGG